MKLKVVAALLATGCCTLAGCSSSGTSANTPASNAAQPDSTRVSTGLATAVANLRPYESANPTMTLTQLSRAVPAGKTIDFIGCPVPDCQAVQSGVQASAKALGWSVRVFDGGQTASSFESAVDDAGQRPGVGVLSIGLLPNTAIQSQLNALHDKGVPYIAFGSPSPTGPDMLADIETSSEFAATGKLMADWVIADSKATANAVLFWDSTEGVELPLKKAFTSEFQSLCPSCHVDTQLTSLRSGIGTTLPGQIVSYLQAHPDTKYVVLTIGDATAGVPQALAAAGLAGKVKIVSRAAGTANLQDLAAGTETMSLAEETVVAGWRMVDAAARHVVGSSVDPTPVGSIHVITKSDLPSDRSVPYSVPGYQEAFVKAWRLTS